jgi:hypothetical protein
MQARRAWGIWKDEDWYGLSRGERANLVALLDGQNAIDHALMEKPSD